jgi:hypothetical protein
MLFKVLSLNELSRELFMNASAPSTFFLWILFASRCDFLERSVSEASLSSSLSCFDSPSFGEL